MQVSDAALATLMAMGYEQRLAAHALRGAAGDVGKAAELCLQHMNDERARRVRDRRSAQLTQQQRDLGKTNAGHWLDMEALQQVCTLLLRRSELPEVCIYPTYQV